MLRVTHGHLGGPGAAAASPIIEPSATAAAAPAPAPSGATLAAFRAEGGPADDPAAALRRAAAPAGRPILPVDARLQKESSDASEAHDTLSDCMLPFFPPRRSSSDRRSSMDGSAPLAATAADGSRFLELAAPDTRGSSSPRRVVGCGLSLPPAPADGGLSLPPVVPADGGLGDDGLRAAPATLGPAADMPGWLPFSPRRSVGLAWARAARRTIDEADAAEG